MIALALGLAIAVSEMPATHAVVHSTQMLSSARRDLGGAGVAAAGVAVFGGGCTDTGEYSCTTGSSTIDLLKPPGAVHHDGVPTVAAATASTAKLSLGRGWPTVCGWANGTSVVFLGGGTNGGRAHKPVVDVLDLATMVVRSSATALDAGRWGTSCVEGSDGSLYFGGGKEVGLFGKFRMTDEVLTMATPDPASVRLAPWKLSVARECTGAASLPGTGIFFAGGWISWTEPGSPFAGADAFPVPAAGTGTAGNYSFGLRPQGDNAYWQGAAGWDDETAYIADDSVIYEVTPAVFNGSVPARTWPLPVAVAGGITAARMNGNGVSVPGAVCFYSAGTAGSALACFHPATATWMVHHCGAVHIAGAIAVVPDRSGLNATVFVAGGQGSTGGTVLTAVVDVFQF